MKLHYFALIIALLSFVSCSEHNISVNTCSVRDPIVDLPWMQKKIEEMKQEPSMIQYYYVIQATHDAQTVFIFANCCPHCDSVFFVYDCQGDVVGTLADDKFDYDLARKGRVIWKPDNSLCAF